MIYNSGAPTPTVLNEIKYYMTLSLLKGMLYNSIITPENYKKSVVSLAEKYRVSRYYI